MFKPHDKRAARQRRHRRIRAALSGTAQRPRLNIFRSLQHIYAQVIDDALGVTLAAASTDEPSVRESLAGTKVEQAKAVGRSIAERAKARGVESVVFDRAGYMYHGRVQALAEGAREGGLQF